MEADRTRTISWSDPREIGTGTVGKTGREVLQAIIDKRLPAAPISSALDFDITEVGEGTATFVGEPSELHCNPMGTIHGGYASTLLDSALGSAVMSLLDDNTAYATSQLSIHLTRPITVKTGPVTVIARVVHAGKRVATAEGTLRDAGGNILAHGTATCMLFPRGS
jgi:uncharacterized protein (TIGR00369 family)